MSTKIISYILCLLLLSAIFGCSTSNPLGYGYTTRDFSSKGWIKVSAYEPGENTAYNRVMYEKSDSEFIERLINQNGLPDYYLTTDVSEKRYAYLNTGMIYVFEDGFRSRSDAKKYHYSKVKDYLPKYLLAEFENNDNSYRKRPNIAGTGSNPEYQVGHVQTNDEIFDKCNQLGEMGYGVAFIRDAGVTYEQHISKGKKLQTPDKGMAVMEFVSKVAWGNPTYSPAMVRTKVTNICLQKLTEKK